MSTWHRFYIIVEGPTEKKFADDLLNPHLAQLEVDLRTRIVATNRKLGKRGGVINYEKIRGDIGRLMREDRSPHVLFTTMIDLYALPPEFPGWKMAVEKKMPKERVEILEEAFAADIGDSRFLPYIQLHEFESLLYCDLSQLGRRLAGSSRGLASLEKEVRTMKPEDINEGVQTAPSKRLIKHVPIYEKSKVRVGAPAAAAIGLHVLRKECPHFGSWIDRMESFAQNGLF